MLNRVCKFLCFALETAIKEIRLHNADYHHRTSEETLKSWDEYIAKVRKSL